MIEFWKLCMKHGVGIRFMCECIWKGGRRWFYFYTCLTFISKTTIKMLAVCLPETEWANEEKHGETFHTLLAWVEMFLVLHIWWLFSSQLNYDKIIICCSFGLRPQKAFIAKFIQMEVLNDVCTSRSIQFALKPISSLLSLSSHSILT